MKDDINEKEKRINEAFQQFEPYIDAEKIWNSIEGRLPQKKKKRRPLFWLFFFLGIITVGFYLFITNFDHQELNPILSNDLVLNTQESKVEGDFTQSHKDHSVNIQKSNSNFSQQHKKTDADLKKLNLITISSNDTIYKENQTKLNDQKNGVEILKNLETLNFSILDIPYKQINKERLNSIALIPLKSLSLISEQKPSEIIIEPLSVNKWKPFISGAFGIHLVNTQFASSSEWINTLFIEEQRLPSFYGNLRGGFENINGWKFSGGMYYLSQFARSTEVQTVNQVMDNAGIVTVYIDDLGNRTTENGQLAVNTIRRFEAQRVRSHQFLGFQVGVNREIWKSRPFSIDIGLASMIDIWSMHRGYILTEEGLSEIPEEPFYSNRRWSFMPQINLWYTHRKWSIGVSPYLIYSNDFLVSSDQPYNIKNSQYGIQLSLMYQP